jgi:hypothetical protein
MDGSAWLRTVVQHHQKRHRQGVSGFDSFTIEPFHTDRHGSEHFRVTISFRNSKGRAVQVYWIVKASQTVENGDDNGVIVSNATRQSTTTETIASSANILVLNHEIRVYTELLSEIIKYLTTKKNQRARYLLNVPDLIFHDRVQRAGKVTRCHLVTEDVSETKRCTPLKLGRIIRGLSLGQFKVLLGTLAQFHAVGIAWSLGTKDDSMLDLFPFLHKTASPEEVKKRNGHLEMYSRLLELHFEPESRQRRLFKELYSRSNELLNADTLKKDMCDVFGGLCLGPAMANEVMFQYETDFFDLCGVGGANNIIWHSISEEDNGAKKDEDNAEDDDDVISPICAAVTTCHRVHFGHILRELATYFFTLPEALVRERYIVFMLQSYCHVLTMTLEMLDVDWQRHFGDLNFNKLTVAFYEHVPQAILQAVIAHMEVTDPDQLEALLSNKKPPVIDSLAAKAPQKHQNYIPLTPKRVHFLLSLLDLVHKSV